MRGNSTVSLLDVARIFTAQDIVQLLVEKFSLDSSQLLPESPLFSSGLLDSFDLIDLLSNLEKLASIRIRPGEVSLANFDTPARIAALLDGKNASKP